MSIKTIIPTAAAVAALFMAGAAGAQTVQSNTASTVGAGAAAAGNSGAIAGGTTAGANKSLNSRAETRRGAQRDRTTTAPTANSSSTYGAGAVYTDQNSTSAGVTAGGSASGSGVQSSGTSIGAYGETTGTGTSADVYGDSTATSGTRAR